MTTKPTRRAALATLTVAVAATAVPAAPKPKHVSRDLSKHVEDETCECLCPKCYPSYRRRHGSQPHVATVLALLAVESGLERIREIADDDDEIALDANHALWQLGWMTGLLDGELTYPAGWERMKATARQRGRKGGPVETVLEALLEVIDHASDMVEKHECRPGEFCHLCDDSDNIARFASDLFDSLESRGLASARLVGLQARHAERRLARVQRGAGMTEQIARLHESAEENLAHARLREAMRADPKTAEHVRTIKREVARLSS